MALIPFKWIVILATVFVLMSCGAAPYDKAKRVLIDRGSSDDDASLTDESDAVVDMFYKKYGIFSPEGWVQRPIQLHFDSNVSIDIQNGVKKAAATWNAAAGFDLIQFGETTQPQIMNLEQRLRDPASIIASESHWCRTGKSKEVIGTTRWDNPNGSKRAISTSDITFNFETYLLTDANSPDLSEQGRDIADAESVALHELGHLLGLTHTLEYIESKSVMNPTMYIGKGFTSRKPSELDIQRIQYLYKAGSPLPPEIIYKDAPIPDPSPSPKPNPPPQSKPAGPCDWTSL